jgi:hypothetical protein
MHRRRCTRAGITTECVPRTKGTRTRNVNVALALWEVGSAPWYILSHPGSFGTTPQSAPGGYSSTRARRAHWTLGLNLLKYFINKLINKIYLCTRSGAFVTPTGGCSRARLGLWTYALGALLAACLGRSKMALGHFGQDELGLGMDTWTWTGSDRGWRCQTGLPRSRAQGLCFLNRYSERKAERRSWS